MFSDESLELRRKLAYACRILAANGHNDTIYGHVSHREAGADTYWMKPSQMGMDEVTPDTMIRIDLDGRIVEGELPRHIEFPIHSEIYRARPEVTCVVHTHPTHAVAFAATGLPMRSISQEGPLFVPDVPRFTVTANLIRTRQEGEAIARILGDAPACFLVYHGIVAADATIEGTVIKAISLEDACKKQLLAAAVNPNFQGVPTSEAETKRDTYPNKSFEHMWHYYCRRIGSL